MYACQVYEGLAPYAHWYERDSHSHSVQFIQQHTCKLRHNLQYHVSDPVHHCEAHSHIEYPSRKVNPLWQVGKQLVIEALNPVCVTTLLILLIIASRLIVTSIHTRQKSSA